VQGRAQGIAGEDLLPESRREFVDAVGWMLSNALENVDEVVVGVDVVQPTGDDQALDEADVFGPEFGPAEEPIFPIMEMFR